MRLRSPRDRAFHRTDKLYAFATLTRNLVAIFPFGRCDCESARVARVFLHASLAPPILCGSSRQTLCGCGRAFVPGHSRPGDANWARSDGRSRPGLEAPSATRSCYRPRLHYRTQRREDAAGRFFDISYYFQTLYMRALSDVIHQFVIYIYVKDPSASIRTRRIFTFIMPLSFTFSMTRIHVRLLGPCYKTGQADHACFRSQSSSKAAKTLAVNQYAQHATVTRPHIMSTLLAKIHDRVKRLLLFQQPLQ